MEDVYIAGAYVTPFGKFPDKSLKTKVDLDAS